MKKRFLSKKGKHPPSSRAAEQRRKSRADGAEQTEGRADGRFEKINIEKKKAEQSRK